MSTRCQVIVKDQWSEIWFYRHCDGYPEGVKPTLDTFCQWLKDNRIRKNAEQSAGWLIVLGRSEYKAWERSDHKPRQQDGPFEPGHDISLSAWKVGAYEPCEKILHGDIEYLYVVNLATASWNEATFDTDANTYSVMIDEAVIA